MLQNNKIK